MYCIHVIMKIVCVCVCVCVCLCVCVSCSSDWSNAVVHGHGGREHVTTTVSHARLPQVNDFSAVACECVCVCFINGAFPSLCVFEYACVCVCVWFYAVSVVPLPSLCVSVCVWIKGARQVHNEQSNTNQHNFSFREKRSCPGWDSNPRHSAFLDRVLFLLSYQGSSASRALSLQYNTTQDKVKPQYSVLWHR